MKTGIFKKPRRPLSVPMIFTALPLLLCACATDNTQGAGSKESPTTETSAAAAEGGASELYSVECGQVNDAGEPFCYVDRDTYVGWRTYHGFCHVCHAQDAVGSTFAPSLLARMRESDMTRELFIDRLDNGFTGQVGVMPPWKDNPNVRKRYNELYSYLMARADGVLMPGRPERFPANPE